jgi:hypothetical protein
MDEQRCVAGWNRERLERETGIRDLSNYDLGQIIASGGIRALLDFYARPERTGQTTDLEVLRVKYAATWECKEKAWAKVTRLTDEVDRLQASNTALLEAIQCVEWAGTTFYADSESLMPSCPACGGIWPGYMPLGSEHPGHKHGHHVDCVLALAIAKVTGSQS